MVFAAFLPFAIEPFANVLKNLPLSPLTGFAGFGMCLATIVARARGFFAQAAYSSQVIPR